MPLVGLSLNLWKLALSPGRQCQNRVESQDTQPVQENCLLVWGTHPHAHPCHKLGLGARIPYYLQTVYKEILLNSLAWMALQEFAKITYQGLPWGSKGFSGGSDRKESACNEGDLGSITGLGRSPGGEHGCPLQYSCLENPHGRWNLEGYRPWGCKGAGHD